LAQEATAILLNVASGMRLPLVPHTMPSLTADKPWTVIEHAEKLLGCRMRAVRP
jgi:hypothetical protein